MATATKSRITGNGTPALGEQMQIVIPRIEPKLVELEIVGTTPLLVCAWSKKAKQQIFDKQTKKAKRGRDAKDPQADYMESRYISDEGWDGIPAGGVKGCLVAACRMVNDLSMQHAKRLFFVEADGATHPETCADGSKRRGQQLVRLFGEPQMHEGMVRIAGDTADIRYRAMYEKWSLRLQISFLPFMISAEQIANLVELAGWCEGLCEHRPGSKHSCTGDFGRFMIKRAK